MGKILGSWSGMRKYLERDMLAERLRGRVRYGCTSYPGMDGCRIFEICVDGQQVKRFSWETVNTYFILHGLREPSALSGTGGYWAGFWRDMERFPMASRTEYTDEEFCAALRAYRAQPIGESLWSDDPLVRLFAILDRRLGRRSLERARDAIPAQPAWLQRFYCLRLEAEGISYPVPQRPEQRDARHAQPGGDGQRDGV